MAARGFVQHQEKKSSDNGDQCDVEPWTTSIEGAHSRWLTLLRRRVVLAAVSPGTVVGVGSNYKFLPCDLPEKEQTALGDPKTDVICVTKEG